MTRNQIEQWLIARLAAHLQLSNDQIETDQPIFAYGIDSKFATALSAELGEFIGRSFDPTLLFDHSSIKRVAEYVLADSAAAGNRPPPAAPTQAFADEAVAVVGIACRMPGASDKNAFWDLLLAGRDAIAQLPEARRSEQAASAAPSGYIDAVDQFDAAFFRIAPTEARIMDPQQRILLQLVWQALEDAGCVPSQLRGTRGGVFIGASHSDYSLPQYAHAGEVSAFSGTGTALSIIANRLSYFYDLQGPSMAIDTACSSSLVATHLAVQSLRRNECDFALAGGVNLLLAPEVTLGLAKAGMLSPDARCRSFDASANGYVRAEGAGVVVLKRLSRAVKDADRIYAVIKGSAVNQDGRSNGLTAPNQSAQEALLRAAYAAAEIEPASVDFVETHGTGTSLGDPVEAKALSKVLCAERAADQPLLLGAVKSNVGHLEAAAGMAGLIKAALALHHKVIPPNLHFTVPNPHIDFAAARLSVPTAARAWPKVAERARIAGVSGFGFGGTNAHVVLAEGPAVALQANVEASSRPQLIMLSSSTVEGLVQAARNWIEWLADCAGDQAQPTLSDIAYTSLARREQLPVRRGFVVCSKTELRAQLSAFVAAPDVSMPPTRVAAERVLFVYSGDAEQWIRHAHELLTADTLFRSIVRRCDEIAGSEAWFDGSIEQTLLHQSALLVNDALKLHVCMFAAQLALTALLKSHGIEPTDLLGHGAGEIAAAVVSGALEMEAGLRIAAERGRCVQRLVRAAEVARKVAGDPASNPATAALDHAASATLQEATGALAGALQGLQPQATRCRLFSGAGLLQGPELTAAHWAANLEAAEPSATALDAVLALEGKVAAVVEITMRPVLHGMLSTLLRTRGHEHAAVVAVGSSSGDAQHGVLSAIKSVHESGANICHRSKGGVRPRLVSLPAYAWRPDRFWLQTARRAPLAGAASTASMLGSDVCNAPQVGVRAWQNLLDTSIQSTLADHKVGDRVLVPAAGQVAMMLQALAASGRAGPLELIDGQFRKALVLGTQARPVQTIVNFRDAVPVTVSVCSAADGGESAVHSQAQLASSAAAQPPLDLAAIRARCQQVLEAAEIYESLAAAGLAYGPSFRLVRELRIGQGDGLATLELPNDGLFSNDLIDLRILDAAFHPMLAIGKGLPQRQGMKGAVPVGFGRLRWFAPATRTVHAYVAMRESDSGALLGTVRLLDEQGQVFCSVEDMTFSETVQRTTRTNHFKALHCYEPIWRKHSPTARKPTSEALRCAIFTDRGGAGAALARRIVAAGGRCLLIEQADHFKRSDAQLSIRAEHAADYRAAFEIISSEFGARLDAVVDLWPLDLQDSIGGDIAASAAQLELIAFSSLEKIKATTNAVFLSPPLLLFATSGVQSIAGEANATRPGGALVTGLLRTVPFENPTLSARCVDLAVVDAEQVAEELLAELSISDAEMDVARVRGQRYVRRIINSDLGANPAREVRIHGDGAYLVTGANGGIGRGLVEWLVDQGARRIIMLGRRPHSAAIASLQAQLAIKGADVQYLSADIGDARALHAALSAGEVSFDRVRGVIHAAGILADGPMLGMSRERLLSVLKPKVHGLLNVMQHLDASQLDWLVLFSSAASILGSPGQANYCAANAFLDAYAQAARSIGITAISAGWGPWAEVGMAAEHKDAIKNIAAGLNFITPADGFAAFGALLAQRTPHLGVFPFDLYDLVQHYPEGPGFSAFDELFDQNTILLRAAGRSNQVSQRPTMEAAYLAPRSDVERTIAGMWQRALGVDKIGVNDSFFELGGDSVFGNQVVVEIGHHFSVSIEPERAFANYTVAGLAELVEQKLLEEIEGLSDDAAAAQLAQAEAAEGSAHETVT